MSDKNFQVFLVADSDYVLAGYRGTFRRLPNIYDGNNCKTVKFFYFKLTIFAKIVK